MYKFSQQLNDKLIQLAQKRLEKGELTLFAKAIADELPLPPIETDNISMFNLTKRNYIDNVIYAVNDFTYIDESQRKTIYKLIDEMTLWRFNVAYNPPSLFFKGDTNSVVDDFSGLLRNIDATYLCSVADIVDKANWLYTVFREAAAETKLTQTGD